MSFNQDSSGLSNTTAGLDVFGNAVKKNKGIISRMKRSLSTSGRPQPLKLSSGQTSSLSEWSSPTSTVSSSSSPDFRMNMSPSSMQRSFSPIPSNLSSPTPKGNSTSTSSMSSNGYYIVPSPTAHLSYETFASSSASNLSIRSFPAVVRRRASSNDTTNVLSLPQEKLQAKSMFESRLIENERVSMTKLISSNASRDRTADKNDARPAPAPAMYWSCPQMYGTKPPKLRAHASVVYEDKMYVYGGTGKTLCSDTLYVLELDTFTWFTPQVYGTKPPACRAHCLLVDDATGKLYLFGGGDGQKYHNHFYVLDTRSMTWSRPKTSGNKPSERRAHVTAIWNQNLYVFGGGDGTKALNDVYRLDLKTREWSLITTSGPKPTSRGYHTGTLVGSKLVIFGGSDGKECFGGVHVLDLESETWYSIDIEDQQIPRLSHSAICIGSFLFVIAGHDGAQYCNDLFMLNLVNMSWETRSVYGQAPTPRGYHTTILYDSRIFLFGGYNGTSFSNDVYILDLASYAYLPQIVKFTIDTF